MRFSIFSKLQLRACMAAARIGWHEAVEHRVDFFMSLLSWGIRLFITFFLWFSIIDSKTGEIGGYTFNKILIYFFLVQIIGSLQFNHVGFDVARDIYRGEMTNFLLKPFNYVSMRLFHSLGKQTFRVLIAVGIFGGLISAVADISIFALWKLPLFLIALIGAYLINFYSHVLIGMMSFWVENSSRFLFTYFGILTMLSGMLIPLDLFPSAVLKVLFYLPFPYLFFFPATIALAQAPGAEWLQLFFFEFLYVAGLAVLVAFIFHRGLRQFEAIGR